MKLYRSQKLISKCLFPVTLVAILIAVPLLHLSVWAGSQILLKIPSMTCSSCQDSIREALLQIKGVEKVEFNMKKKVARVDLAGDPPPSRESLIAAVKSKGYDVGP